MKTMKPLFTKGQIVYVYNYDSESFFTHVIKKNVMPVHAVKFTKRTGPQKGMHGMKHNKVKLGYVSFYVNDLVYDINRSIIECTSGCFLVFTNKKAFKKRILFVFERQLKDRVNKCEQLKEEFMKVADAVGESENHLAKIKKL